MLPPPPPPPPPKPHADPLHKHYYVRMPYMEYCSLMAVGCVLLPYRLALYVTFGVRGKSPSELCIPIGCSNVACLNRGTFAYSWRSYQAGRKISSSLRTCSRELSHDLATCLRLSLPCHTWGYGLSYLLSYTEGVRPPPHK